ncbi:NUDIX domain-containing protein [Embleya scabrispora]|uniref:NUDIX domain-containing protein n=1 Tax=Embleya scabrispora TaxID=159449 RepID=UPI002AA29C32|nr:NUDIX domain-containing protein [Embleya scabrispora]
MDAGRRASVTWASEIAAPSPCHRPQGIPRARHRRRDPDRRRRQVLFVRHLALDAWLLPGGHPEPTGTTLIGAAMRELAEETGIRFDLVVPLRDDPVHIDIHSIPANAGKGEDDEVADAAWRYRKHHRRTPSRPSNRHPPLNDDGEGHRPTWAGDLHHRPLAP